MADEERERAELQQELAAFATEVLALAARVGGIGGSSLPLEIEHRVITGRVREMGQKMKDFARRHNYIGA